MLLAYIRVSTQEQADDDRTSLAEQERICRGIAMVRGIDKMDITIYSDPGVSGATPLRFRPQGKKLVNDMQSGDIVVASKLDRMFRSACDALVMAEQMKAKGVSLILADMGHDSVTGDGMAKAFFTMAAAFAELERSTIAGRMREAKKAKRARGGYVGGSLTYGFRAEGKGYAAKIAIDEQEQGMVDLIVRLRRRGHPPSFILQRLNKDGYKTRSGREFQIIQIQRIVNMAKKTPAWTMKLPREQPVEQPAA